MGSTSSRLSASHASHALRNSRTIHGTRLRTRIPKEPWKRSNGIGKDPELCCQLGMSVSKPDELTYHSHKRRIKKQQGANFGSPFFKTRISSENPEWMHLRDLEPDKYLSYKTKVEQERRQKTVYEISKKNASEGRDAVSSYEAPLWFRTSKNGKKPLKHVRSLPYGNRTLPIYEAPPGTKTGMKFPENRTARRNARANKSHNRTRTQMVEFVRAAVKQGVRPFER